MVLKQHLFQYNVVTDQNKKLYESASPLEISNFSHFSLIWKLLVQQLQKKKTNKQKLLVLSTYFHINILMPFFFSFSMSLYRPYTP